MTNQLDLVFMRLGPQAKAKKAQRASPSVTEKDIHASRGRSSQTFPQQLRAAVLGE